MNWEENMLSMKTVATIFSMAIGAASAGFADELGKRDYMSGCAGCHGESGLGEGQIAELLTISVPDLTTLSENNDGEFPMLQVIHVIDGRTGLRAHGGPMPVWGDIYKMEAAGSSGVAGGAEALARGRILSIAYYLESIQK